MEICVCDMFSYGMLKIEKITNRKTRRKVS